MKKATLLCALIILLLLPAIALTSYAHPGGTDGRGGHTDNSTGEYHYHHGYPAHDHYDMDGDGDTDCPYAFVDNTGINSGESSYSSSYYSNNSGYNDNVIVKTETVTKKVPYIPSWMYFVIGLLGVICIILIVNIRCQNKAIRDWEIRYSSANAEHEKSVSEIKRTCSAKVEQNKNFYENKLQEIKYQLSHYRTSLSELGEENTSLKNKYQLLLNAPGNMSVKQVIDGIQIPTGVYLVNGNVPVKGKISDKKPFGDYTVYVADHGKCFHLDNYCGSGLYRAKHIYEVIGKKSPCAKCAFSTPTEIPEWYLQLSQVTSNAKK